MPLMKDNGFTKEVPPENVKLLGDRLVARVVRKPRIQRGLLVPESFDRRTQLARVATLGTEYTGPCKVGDVIVYRNWSGREWQSPDESIILLTPDETEAIIETD